MVILPFLAMCFMALKGFVYTIGVDVYAFLSRILRQIAPHLAAFHLAFSTKTHFI